MSLTPATTSTIKEKITERIRSSFIELIPEDQWKELVERELHEFIKDPEKDSYGRQVSSTSPLKHMIRDAIREIVMTELQTYLTSPEFKVVYKEGRHGPSEGVKHLVKELAPELIEIVMQRALQDIVAGVLGQLQNMRSSLRQQ